jgi:hypothetical protein
MGLRKNNNKKTAIDAAPQDGTGTGTGTGTINKKRRISSPIKSSSGLLVKKKGRGGSSRWTASKRRGLLGANNRRAPFPNNGNSNNNNNSKRVAQRCALLFLVVMLHHVEKQELATQWHSASSAVVNHPTTNALVQHSRDLFQKASTGMRSTWDKLPSSATSMMDTSRTFTTTTTGLLSAEQLSKLTSWTKDHLQEVLMTFKGDGDGESSSSSTTAAAAAADSSSWKEQLKQGASRATSTTTQFLSETSRAPISLAKAAGTYNKRLLQKVGTASKAVLSFQINLVDVAACLIVSSTKSLLEALPTQTTTSRNTVMQVEPLKPMSSRVPKNLEIPQSLFPNKSTSASSTTGASVNNNNNNNKNNSTSSMTSLMGMPHFDSLPSQLVPRTFLRTMPDSDLAQHNQHMETPTIRNLSREHSKDLWKAATEHSQRVLRNSNIIRTKTPQERFQTWVQRIQGATPTRQYFDTVDQQQEQKN